MSHKQGRIDLCMQIQQKKSEKRQKKKMIEVKKKIEKNIEKQAKQFNKYDNDGSFLKKVVEKKLVEQCEEKEG